MQTMPNAAEPTLPPPSGGPLPPADRGLAQLVVTSLLVVLSFSAGWFGNGYVNRNNYVPNDEQHKYQHVMNEAWNDINANFVVTQNIDQQKMAYAAIDGMISTLNDPGHTRFLTPEETQREAQQFSGAGIVGIGISVSGGGKDPITIVIVFPKDADGNQTPAAKAGLQSGDQIVAVDGTDVRGKTLDQVTSLITGAENTSVTITYIRPSVSPTATTTTAPITRKKYKPPHTGSYIIPQLNIAHIQLLDFLPGADAELRTRLKDAQDQHVAGIIFDLRGNGGGALDEAVAVTSEFVPAGTNKNVLFVRDRTSRKAYPVTSGGLATTTPLAILIDHNTASAAEITAGAIAIDRTDTQTVGQTTYGTGTVLEQMTLSDGSSLYVGVSLWLLPDSTSVYHTGVQPEQPVALPAKVAPLTPLSAPGNKATYDYIQKYNDTQLLQAIKDVQQQAASKPAA